MVVVIMVDVVLPEGTVYNVSAQSVVTGALQRPFPKEKISRP